MRKFLSWLLILLLPVAGLFGGMWLVPAAKPLWQKEFEYCVHLVGFVEEGQTLLVGEVTSTRQMFLIGINPVTGEERFRQPLTAAQLQTRDLFIREAVLSDDPRYVVIPAEEVETDEHFQVLVYDWKRTVVVTRFHSPTQNYIKEVTLRRGILTAVSEGEFLQWKMDKADHVTILKTKNQNQRGNFITDDSTLAIHASISSVENLFEWKKIGVITFFDLEHQQLWSKRAGSTMMVFLRYDGNRFSTIEGVAGENDDSEWLVVREYLIDRDREIQQIGEGRPLGVMGTCRSSSDAVFVLDRVGLHWRTKINRFLSDIFKDQLPLFLSNPNRLCVYDRSTMKLLDQITIPEEYQDLIRKTQGFHVNRHQPGIAIATERKIDYWQLNSFTRYFPILGLLIGSLFTLLLIICRYRVARRRLVKASTLMPASSGD